MQPIVSAYGDQPLPPTVSLTVARVDLEKDFLAQNLAALKAIAEASGGRYLTVAEADQLPSLLAIDHPLVGELERRVREVTGVRPDRVGQSGATVAKFLILRGIPAAGFSCGPEAVEHQAGEWISLDELARFAEVMARVLADLMRGGIKI
jgi:acetylornithine deacetylase/succinyl-diaminopimelate desuccinylase-like protein